MSVCGRCETRLDYVGKDVCLYCKKDSPFGLTHERCVTANGITGAMSIFNYNPFLKRIIAAIKYDLAITVWRDFSLTIRPAGLYKLNFFKSLKKVVYFVPTPLHPRRRRLRGFNQADLIATWAQGYIDIPIRMALERKKDTVYQARLRETADRGKNVKNAFTATEHMAGHTVIIVDDVMTTGATVKEAARACFKSGAEAVYALAIAHG